MSFQFQQDYIQHLNVKNHDYYLDTFKYRNDISYDEFCHIFYVNNLYFYNYYYHSFYPKSDDDVLWTKKRNPKKINIDISVQTMDDLIKIIDKYPYDENNKYNIDLKSLSNIKTELIQLNQMIGLGELKKSILQQLLYFIQKLHIIDDNNENMSSEFKHTIICGPPGTGKTEIAQIIGKMYSKIGILTKNTFKKASRSDFIAEYLGQTAIKTKTLINECLGGVLFIDEAYSLGNHNKMDSYSKECLDVLCEALSEHKNDLMVIVAGYEDELNETFFKINKGLRSRFIWKFKINDYTPDELHKIFLKKIEDLQWKTDNTDFITAKWFEKNKNDFGNYGRDVELLLTYSKISHSTRIFGKSTELRKKLNSQDIKQGYEMFLKNKKQTNKNKILDSLYI